MPNHKAIITALAKVQGEVKANCKCGGSNRVQDCKCPSYYDWAEKCSDCAEVRALDLCWHSCEKGTIDKRYIPEEVYYCDGCGEGPRTFKDDWGNPDLTTHMHGSKLWLTHVLEVLGLWEEFIYWQSDRLMANVDGRLYRMDFADILTDGKLLMPVVEAYLKEREG